MQREWQSCCVPHGVSYLAYLSFDFMSSKSSRSQLRCGLEDIKSNEPAAHLRLEKPKLFLAGPLLQNKAAVPHWNSCFSTFRLNNFSYALKGVETIGPFLLNINRLRSKSHCCLSIFKLCL